MPSHSPAFPTFLLFRRTVLAGVVLAAAGSAQGGTVSGNTHTVKPGDPLDSWTLTGGATLNVLEGGATKQINATDSTVVVTGGDISSYGQAATLILARSSATITGSTLISGNNAAVKMDNADCTGDGCGVLMISDSNVTGYLGVVGQQGADITLSATQVQGKVGCTAGEEAGCGNALILNDGVVRVTDGSSAVGDTHGAWLQSDGGGASQSNTLLLDGSHVEGTSGSAIVVGLTTTDNSNVENTIEVANGSTLTGGNGLLLDVRNASTVHFIVDDSQLTGDVLASEQSTLDVTLRNGASLTGQLSGVDSFALSASQFSGSMHVASGDAVMRIAEGSTATGDNGALLDVQGGNAQLVVDASTATGDVLAGGGSTQVFVQHGAQFSGQLNATAGDNQLVVDDGAFTGSVVAGADSTAVFVQNGAQFDGQMTVTRGENGLTVTDGSQVENAGGPLLDVQGGNARVVVDASSASGDVLVGGSGGTDLFIQNGSQFSGQLDVTGGDNQLLVDSSTFTGNVQLGGGSTDVYLQNGAQLNGQMTVTGGEAGLAFLNGATVVNGTGTLLDVQGGHAKLLIEDSQVSGDILAGGDSTAVYLRHGAQLNGQMTVTGGDASLAILDGASMANSDGPLLDVQGGAAQMIVDNANVSGDVLASGGSTDVFVQNGAQLDGQLTVTSGDARLVVSNGAQANADSPLLDVQGGSGELIVDNATAQGDVVASGDGSASVTLENFGVLTGQLENVSQLNVNSGATWNMVGDARVESLAMQGGYVDFGKSSDYRSLTLGSLSGTGTFAMSTGLTQSELAGDFLTVEGAATGDYQLHIKGTGEKSSVDSTDDSRLQVVHTGSGDAQFSVLGGGVDVGTYQYQLASYANADGSTDWWLEHTSVITPSTASVLGLFSAAPSVWYGELSSLRSRMGEVRNGQQDGGVWVRTYANRYKLSAAGDLTYAQNQNGLSLGADGQLPTAGGQWLLGVMAGTSKSDLDLKRGTSGDVESYYVGVYGTWLADNGYYVDAVLKANRFDNSSDVRMSDGTKAKGSYDNDGLGLSVEAGKHIKLQDDWFVEPYAQVASLWVDGDKYRLDNGMQAQSNHANSLLGKAGMSFGKRVALPKGGFAEPYAKLAVAHEFTDDNRVKVNEDRFTNDLSGTRGEIGAGVAAQVSEKLQLHLDLDYSKGESVEQPYGVNLGMRYNF